MADHGTAIEWTQAPGFKGETWNPVTGCDRVSPGCANCYALDLAARLKGMGQKRYQKDGDPKSSGPGFGLTLHPDKLEDPLRWRKPRMVFVNSMSDLFHEEIPDDFVIEAFNTMAKAGQHIFQILTKRPERMVELVEDVYETLGFPKPLPNVWLGVSIENRRFVHRADLLRNTPAAVRFVSAEPLLGPLATGEYKRREYQNPAGRRYCDTLYRPPLDLTDIDWLIVGGESGPKHRPIQPEWVRGLRDAAIATGRRCANCAGAGQYERVASEDGSFEPYPAVCDDCRGRGRFGGTSFFFKQWGGRTPKAGGRELDGRTWDEFPQLADAVA